MPFAFKAQIREQMVVPDLYVFTLKLHSYFSMYKNMKKKFKHFFDPEKVKKLASKVAHNRPRPTAHGPELIFHIMKTRDQRSVLLSVSLPSDYFKYLSIMHISIKEVIAMAITKSLYSKQDLKIF